MCAEATDNIRDSPAVLSLTLALSRREREPSGWRLGPCKRSAAGQDIRHGTCILAGWRLSPYPARGSCGLPLIYSPLLLKLPVLAASKSLRRSRKAGAARMDAG